jgi:hypothetical protein
MGSEEGQEEEEEGWSSDKTVRGEVGVGVGAKGFWRNERFVLRKKRNLNLGFKYKHINDVKKL